MKQRIPQVKEQEIFVDNVLKTPAPKFGGSFSINGA
jgi:hypothetical protein